VRYWRSHDREQVPASNRPKDRQIGKELEEKLHALLMFNNPHSPSGTTSITDEVQASDGPVQQVPRSVAIPWNILQPNYCPPISSKKAQEFDLGLQKHVEDCYEPKVSMECLWYYKEG